MSEIRIYFLRHGVTEWNEAGRWQGQTDIPLTEVGMAQADAVAERLVGEKFDTIYSSDLDRAFATAQAVATQQGNQSIIKTKVWRERFAGVFEGMTSAEIADQYPEAYAQMLQGFLEPPKGESFTELASRIQTELDRLLEVHSGEQILIVSHGGTIRAVTHATLGVAQDRTWAFQVGNTALSLMVHTARGWTLEFWNDTNHLDSIEVDSKQQAHSTL